MPPPGMARPPPTARAARAAGLHWTSDREPGLARVPARGGGFAYRDAQGRAVRDEATLARIRRLAIPPAWTDVWICARDDGHLQATGHDARGRKQYRYHPAWAAGRGETKFAGLLAFGRVLPKIRRRVQRALAGPDEPTRSRVLATLVRLLDTTWLRIGNEAYARENRSYGLSTLRARHAGVKGDAIELSFVGKSGVRHQVRITDRRVARIVRRCRELPGQELFRWVDEHGSSHPLGSADVNAWLAEAAGTHVTAKDFRTWHGSVLALELTLQACALDAGAEPRRATHVLADVARRLGNTPAVCRKAYVHPRVLALGDKLANAAEREGLAAEAWALAPPKGAGLSAAERRLMGLLRRREPAAGLSRTPGRSPAASRPRNARSRNVPARCGAPPRPRRRRGRGRAAARA